MQSNFTFHNLQHKKLHESEAGYMFVVYKDTRAVAFHVFLKNGSSYPVKEDFKEKKWAWEYSQDGLANRKFRELKKNPMLGIVRTI